MSNIACVQMTSTNEVSENLREAERLIEASAKAGAQMVVLPENFALMGMQEVDKLQHAENAENAGTGMIQDFLAAAAKKYAVWIVGGTIPIKSEIPNKVFAATLVFDAEGQNVARYDKIHLFDVNLPGSKESYHESASIKAGRKVCVIDTPLGRMGVAVCYDLRFPELFRLMQQQGMEFLVLPSAFTAVTGAAHWQVLLRARAIENLCYVAASAQVGRHVNKRETYGHSMIINPWGEIMHCLAEGTGFAMADIDPGKLQSIRSSFPALQHRIF